MPMNALMPSPARTISRQASVPSEPLREITPTAPGAKTRGLNAGMKPTKHSPGVTRPAVLGPITGGARLARGREQPGRVLQRHVLGQHDELPAAGGERIERRGLDAQAAG